MFPQADRDMPAVRFFPFGQEEAIDWIAQLGDLPIGIAFAVVYVIGLILILRYVIHPFQDSIRKSLEDHTKALNEIVENHLSHDREDRKVIMQALANQMATFQDLVRKLIRGESGDRQEGQASSIHR